MWYFIARLIDLTFLEQFCVCRWERCCGIRFEMVAFVVAVWIFSLARHIHVPRYLKGQDIVQSSSVMRFCIA